MPRRSARGGRSRCSTTALAPDAVAGDRDLHRPSGGRRRSDCGGEYPARRRRRPGTVRRRDAGRRGRRAGAATGHPRHPGPRYLVAVRRGRPCGLPASSPPVASNGIYLQSPDDLVDGVRPRPKAFSCSRRRRAAGAAIVGTAVTVTGVVEEFGFETDPAITEITAPTFAAGVTAGNPLPAPITLTMAVDQPAGGVLARALRRDARPGPVADRGGAVARQRERDDRGRVEHRRLLRRADRGRQAGARGRDRSARTCVPPCAAGTGCTIPVFDQNPERLRVDSDAIAGVPAAVVTTGAVLANVVGVVDYGFRTWTILPTSAITPSSLAVGVAARPRGATSSPSRPSICNASSTRWTTPPPTIPCRLPPPTISSWPNCRRRSAATCTRRTSSASRRRRTSWYCRHPADRIDADALAASQPPPGTWRISSRATTSAASTSAS